MDVDKTKGYLDLVEDAYRAAEGKFETDVKALLGKMAAAMEDLIPRADRVRVKTQFGDLIAHESDWGEEYPGIYIDLHRDELPQADMSVVLVETTATESDLPQKTHLIARVYGDGVVDEYTDRVVIKNTEQWFAQHKA